MTQTSILKPGLLVSLKTTIEGGVHYKRVDLAVEGDEKSEGGDLSKWETTRLIEDAQEHTLGVQVRGLAGSLVRKVCSLTSFGLICVESKEAELDAAILEARKRTDEFNSQAKHSRVSLYILKGRIAATDEEAAMAIASEIKVLLGEMESGIRSLDVKAVREAATRAKQTGQILNDDRAQIVSSAVKAARKAAREIVKRVEKGGESAAAVLATIAMQPIEAARFAFLDLDEARPADSETMPAISQQRMAELDLEPATAPSQEE